MKRIFVFLISTLFVTSLVAQVPAVFTGPAGLYIKAGKEFPRQFIYRIEMKDKSGSWQRIQQLTFPKHEAEFRTRIMDAAALLPHLSYPTEADITRVWKKAMGKTTVDSLYLDAANPLFYYAFGLGTILRINPGGQENLFRVVKLDPNTAGIISEIEVKASGNTKPLNTKIKSIGYRASGKTVSIDFEVLDFDRMQDVQVFRGHRFRKDFEEIRAPGFFSKKDGKYILTILDEGTLNNMAYSYFVVPFDLMGTMGISSDTLDVNSVAEKSMITYFKDFKATSLEDENGIKLSWSLSSPKDVVSVEIYRSLSYDGEYQRIASVSPSETGYTDFDVEPVTGYFYQCQFNGNYQKSFPAPRIPAMLHANQPNLFPPNGITATVSGNIVQLSWNRQDKDTHGYYLYKGDGFEGELRLFSRLITSSEQTVQYSDTLEVSDTTRTLSYAVADVNTSYAISLPSERTAIQIPAGRIPFPTGLTARKSDQSVLLIWEDVMVSNSNISGYQVFRTVEDPEGRLIEERRMLSPGNNTFTHNYFNDTLAKPGTTCVYEIRSVGLSPDILSSFCQPVRVVLPEKELLPPSNIKLFTSGNQVIIQWDEPLGQEIEYVLITRTGSDKKVHEVRAGSTAENEWIDTGLKSGETYYYFLSTVGKNGKESNSSEPLGITVE